MKKHLLKRLGCLSALAFAATTGFAQTTGPSSSQSPYLKPTVPGATWTSLLTAGDVAGGYRMCGTPDGVGAWDNGDGTFTMLVNHEFGNTAGAIRAHGSRGSFVSRWIIDKSTLAVLGGTDLIQNVNLWNPTTSTYTTYTAANPNAAAAMNRFCSADLAPVSAYYNSASSKGTQARIFMNGEESGTEGRGFAHVASGPNAGATYEVPYLGKFSWENSVASPYMSDTTVVVGLDDATPGQVYIYVGVKKNTGSEIEKAGLTGGKLYGVSVAGLLNETNAGVPPANTAFTLADLGIVHSMTGTALQTASNNAGVTQFLRPEDGAWDPANPSDFYFATTNNFNANSRLWRLRFTNPANPALGGTITAVLEGNEGQQMLDNITVDHWGHVLMVEDVGGNAHIGKTWQYTIATDSMKHIASHDSTRFLTGAPNFLTQDEEASGVLDAQEILGAGMFLIVDQAHYAQAGEVVEGGQLLAFFNPDSYNSNPEISVKGNTIDIANGSTTPLVSNNTDFGNISNGSTVTKTFVIRNAGPGSLLVSGINITGTNASEFTIASLPTFPVSIAANDSLSLTVQFAPAAIGLRKAVVHIVSNDFDEKNYDFAIQGIALNATGIGTLAAGAPVKLYPNPTANTATIELSLTKDKHITINVLDLQGRQVLPAIDNNYKAGNQKVFVNTASLPNGTYFVQMASGSQTTRMKMVVAH